jgi:hypothetical protein
MGLQYQQIYISKNHTSRTVGQVCGEPSFEQKPDINDCALTIGKQLYCRKTRYINPKLGEY